MIQSTGNVVFGTSDGGLYGTDSYGYPRWSYTRNPGATIQLTPAVSVNDDIYAGTATGTFFCVNSNGNSRWSLSVGSSVKSSPGGRGRWDGVLQVFE